MALPRNPGKKKEPNAVQKVVGWVFAAMGCTVLALGFLVVAFGLLWVLVFLAGAIGF